ncbi:PREDICTED: BPI fold-containing family B member 3-like [Gavialis gangeticus]|uniref:BPI fold-containing family B member 3-like n=1 Tax=Gavialis gangeticus TaxID=94835 RepID=UPI00092F343F|nr:PREDICTED: BPI fold-containing family B member 3-like [Gavialis gangeticus]
MNALIKLLPQVLCPVIDTVVSLTNTVIHAMDTAAPIGKLGHIHYLVNGLPLVNGQHLQVDLNALVTDAAGHLIAPQMGPGAPMSLAPVSDHTSQVVLSESLLNTVFALLHNRGDLDMDITSPLADPLVPLTSDAIKPKIPKVSHLIPKHLPLVVRIRLASPPQLTLHDWKATLNVTVSIEVLIRHKNATLQPLFTVDGNVILSLSLSVKDHKLHFNFQVESVRFWLASSHFGPFDISDIEDWLRKIFESLHLPKLRTVLEAGVPLPQLFNMDLTNAAVDITDRAVVLTKMV